MRSKNKYSIANIPFIGLPLMLMLFVCMMSVGVGQVHASEMSVADNDSNTVDVDDVTQGNEDDDLIESNVLTVKPSSDSLQPFTLQGTKASTLRSRAVYIVNGKKRIKK